MNSLMRNSLSCFCFLLTMLTVVCAQKVKHSVPQPAPNVISRVTSAKKVFLSNAGADGNFAKDITAGANGSYNELYSSLKQWGYFQLVDSPAQADLVFEIKGTETCHDERIRLSYHYARTCSTAMMNLTILNPLTRDFVYKISIPAGRGINRSKGKIAFTHSIGVLTDKIKALVAVPVATQNP